MTGQILPGFTLFHDGTPTVGAYPAYYTRCQLRSTAETTTGYGLQFGWGELYDGFREAFGTDSGAAAFTRNADLGSADQICTALWGQRNEEDNVVTINPQAFTYVGDSDDDSFRCVGVVGRVRNGTLANSSSGEDRDSYLHDVDGYAFLHVNKTGPGHQFFLLRFNAGAITILDQADVEPGIKGPLADILGSKMPRRMQMSVETNGSGNVELKCYRRKTLTGVGPGQVATGGGGLTQQDEEIFNVVDSTGSKITGAGRWGFVGQAFRNQGSNLTGVVIDLFKVQDPNGGGVRVRDLFQRWAREAGRLIIPVNHSVFGYSLMSAFTGDGHGPTAVDHWGHLTQDPGQGRLSFGDTIGLGSGQVHGYYMSARPADGPSQHRSLDFTPLNVHTSISREHGLFLRGTWSVESSPNFRGGLGAFQKTGYEVVVIYDGASWSLEYRHYSTATTIDVPATVLATGDVSGAGLGLGTTFGLDVEVQNFFGDDSAGGGIPGIRAKVNGSVITPTVGSVAGVDVVDDWVLDYRSGATQDGKGEGFVFYPGSPGSVDMVRVDNWLQETLSDPPVIDSGNQESVPVAGETDGKAGTLEVPLSWPITVSYQFESLRHRMETGHEVVHARYPSGRRIWKVQARGVTTAQRQALETFWDDHDGCEIPFDWVHPITGETVAAHFLDDELGSALIAPDDVEEFDFQLQELFA